MIFESSGDMMLVPRVLRITFWDRRLMKWFLPAKFLRTLPVAVNEKRFLALDFDLSFGISLSSEMMWK